MQRNIVFIAGPYAGDNPHDASSYLCIDQNIATARAAMAALVEYGYGVFCAHMHSAHFEVILPHVGADYWYELDLHFLRHCNAVLRLPGYSKGADREVASAIGLGLPVYYSLQEIVDDLPVWK